MKGRLSTLHWGESAEFFQELFAILFVGNRKDDDIFRYDSIISSEVTASETIKRRGKAGQFFDTGLADGERG